MLNEVVIVSATRTPLGSFMGSLSGFSAVELGTFALNGAISKVNLSKDLIDEIFIGHVLQAGCGQAPARQASIFAGLPNSVHSLTINKMCGSGLESIMIADQLIKNDPDQIIIAGGMESMSQAPHYLMNSRTGTRLGESKLVDGMIVDGLWDVYNDKHMGNCAEMCAEKFSITRKEQDDFAIQSYERSQPSLASGVFENVTIVSSSTEYQAANYYTDTSGSIVYLGVDGSGNLLDPGATKNEITNEQAYFNINESLRQIRVIRPSLINNVVSSYKKAIRE